MFQAAAPEDALQRLYVGKNSAQEASPAGQSEQAIDSPETSMPKRKTFLSKPWQKALTIVLVILLVLGSAGGALAFYTYTVVKGLKTQADEMQITARGAYDQFKGQNLPATEESLKKTDEQLQGISATYKKLAFYKGIPIANAYYSDGEHGLIAADAGLQAGLKTVAAIRPYADVLGFEGAGTFTGGTTEDRLKVLLDTLIKVTPELDKIAADLNTVKTEMAYIDPARYPEQFQGKPIRQYVTQAKDISNGAYTALTEFRPAIERIPDAAGADNKRKRYFVIFQNDNELRPTGGFLTAYSLIFVENGKVTPEKSTNIYDLDKKFKKNIPIPPILGKYLTTETRWNLRDMNTSPDFKTSMDQFIANYKLVPDEPQDLDGVVALDTHVLVDLLKVLGPVEVPGYGTFTAENTPACDCPQIIYALSDIITKPTPYMREDRKGVLGPMMRAILTKAYSAPKTQWPQLFEIAWKSIEERHTQMYFFDPATQAAAEKLNAAGRLTADTQKGDFLAVVDANLGGAKSNLFVTMDIKQEVTPPVNGELNKKVTITYKNTRHADNCNLEAGKLCLNSTLRDWNRIYLPKGSTLVNSTGYKTGSVKQYDEGEFTVIDGEFTLEPLSQAKLQLEYTVPYTDTQKYRVKLWKQGGLDTIPVVMDVNGNEEQIQFAKDTVYETKFE